MIEASKEFRRFAEAVHEDAHTYGDPAAMINSMYLHLKWHARDKDEWLERGRAVISFLEEALEGPYTDDELAHMWLQSGADIYFLSPDIRDWLTLLLEKTREFQAQNEAGNFTILDVDGNPWTPRR